MKLVVAPLLAIASLGWLAQCGPPPAPVAYVWGDSNASAIAQGINDDARWTAVDGYYGQCSTLGGSVKTPNADFSASVKEVGCPVGTDWRTQLRADLDAHPSKYLVVHVGTIDMLDRPAGYPAPNPANFTDPARTLRWQAAVTDVKAIAAEKGRQLIWVNVGHFPHDPTCSAFQATYFSPSFADSRVDQEDSETAAVPGIDVRDVRPLGALNRTDCVHYDQPAYDQIGSWVINNTP